MDGWLRLMAVVASLGASLSAYVGGLVPFDGAAHSTTDPASIWVVVNKTHPISPSDFRPEPMAIVRGYQVAAAAAPALERMIERAGSDGVGLRIRSAYRSYAYQQGVHAALEASSGAAHADRYSARAGYSEHETGLAVDFGSLSDPGCNFAACFGRTEEGRWLERHAWTFGFLVRYAVGNRSVTGYEAEPWHVRFVGRPLAAELRREGVTTLEEFFGITGGGYSG